MGDKSVAIVSLTDKRHQPCVKALLQSIYAHETSTDFDFYVISQTGINDITDLYPVHHLAVSNELSGMHPYYHKWTLFKELQGYRYVMFLDADILFFEPVMTLVNYLIESMGPDDWVIMRDNGPALGKNQQFSFEFHGGNNTVRKLDMLKLPHDMFNRLIDAYGMHRRYFRQPDQTAMLVAFEGHWRVFWPCIPFRSFGADEDIGMKWPCIHKKLASKGYFFHHGGVVKRCL
eukprot:3936697-Rhodomonas_salina.1